MQESENSSKENDEYLKVSFLEVMKIKAGVFIWNVQRQERNVFKYS